VGGAIGGLTVICLTILGIVLVRRKHGDKGPAKSPPSHTQYDGNEFPEVVPHAQKYGNFYNNHHWDSSYGPVEMYSGNHVEMEPVELSEQVQSTDPPNGTR